MDFVLLSEKNHVANSRKKLEDIYKNRRYCDIAIICSDGELQAHFLILVCYFNFLKTDGQWKPAEKMIFLPSFTKSAVEHVLDIIYLGKTRVPKKDVPKVVEVASFLKVDVERVERHDEARDPDSQVRICETILYFTVLGVCRHQHLLLILSLTDTQRCNCVQASTCY